MKDLITVIIPVYNVEKYLEKCLKSILEQDYNNLEILLIDDGSTDNSSKILDDYAKIDGRIKVIHKANDGVSSARNIGLKYAKGKYICFADSDDYLSKDYVSYLYNLILKYDADISLTTKMFGNFNEKQIRKDSHEVYNGIKTTEFILTYKIPIGVYCKLFKTSLIVNKNIFFNEDLFIGEGFNFNVDCFQRANKVAIGNKKIYYYRRDNSTSATTVFSKNKCLNGLYALDVMKQNFIVDNAGINIAWNFAKWRTYTDIYDMIVLGKAKKNVYKLYINCKKYIKKYACYAWIAKTSKSQKARALIMKICPSLIPMIMKLRRKVYGVKIRSDKI